MVATAVQPPLRVNDPDVSLVTSIGRKCFDHDDEDDHRADQILLTGSPSQLCSSVLHRAAGDASPGGGGPESAKIVIVIINDDCCTHVVAVHCTVHSATAVTLMMRGVAADTREPGGEWAALPGEGKGGLPSES